MKLGKGISLIIIINIVLFTIPNLQAAEIQNVTDIVKKTVGGVVGIRSEIGSGTGFFITPDGLIVTNAHVLGNSTIVSITTTDSKNSPAQIIGINKTMDVALLKVKMRI